MAEGPSQTLPKPARELLAKLQAVVSASGEEDEDNARLTRIAIAVAVAGSLMLVLVLSLTGGEPPVRGAKIDDPKALRPVDVKWEPGKENDGATTGTGGLGGGGGFGGRLLQHRPCTGNEVELPDAVRRTSGIHIIDGTPSRQPCTPTN